MTTHGTPWPSVYLQDRTETKCCDKWLVALQRGKKLPNACLLFWKGPLHLSYFLFCLATRLPPAMQRKKSNHHLLQSLLLVDVDWIPACFSWFPIGQGWVHMFVTFWLAVLCVGLLAPDMLQFTLRMLKISGLCCIVVCFISLFHQGFPTQIGIWAQVFPTALIHVLSMCRWISTAYGLTPVLLRLNLMRKHLVWDRLISPQISTRNNH